jgi:hypothetical protein
VTTGLLLAGNPETPTSSRHPDMARSTAACELLMLATREKGDIHETFLSLGSAWICSQSLR